MTDHTIIFGQGAQAVRTVIVDPRGRARTPSSVTFEIVNLRLHEDADDRVIASGTATIDSASATTTAIAGAGTANRSRIQVDDVAGFSAGRQYLIEYRGQSELIVLDRKDSTDGYLYSRGDLLYQYPVGATVGGIEVSANFPADEAADESRIQVHTPYAVDWTVSGVEGVQNPYRELIWVERNAKSFRATVQDVQRLDQTIDVYTGERISIPTALEAANEVIQTRLQMAGMDRHEVEWGPVGRLAAAYFALASIYQTSTSEEMQDRTRWAQKQFEFYMSSMISGNHPKGSVRTSRSTDAAPAGSGHGSGSIFGIS